MIKVDNRRTMRLLSRRIMDHGRSRNLMAVLAIVMTTFMFTALFTAAASVIKSQQNQEMRMLMNQSHIWAEGLSLEQLELLSKDERVEACGRSRVLGTAVNERLAGDSVILAWAGRQRRGGRSLHAVGGPYAGEGKRSGYERHDPGSAGASP